MIVHLEWANEKKVRGGIKEPSVIGAVLSLGYCCDFLDKRYIKLLAYYFKIMKSRYELLGEALPQNKDLQQDAHKDKIRGYSEFKIFDSTRGVFTEGGPAFDGAGLFEKSHIQICIRNPNCIQGFFMPRKEIDFIDWLERKTI